MADDKPIIVIKKKGSHGGHHGGAWKIAYADFVTAMMAFFMVMWLLSAAESSVRKAVSSYFRRPGIFQEGSGTPLMMGASGILTDGVPPSEYRGVQETNGKVQAPPKSEEQKAKIELADEIDLKIKELKKILEKMKKNGDGEAEKLLAEMKTSEDKKIAEKQKDQKQLEGVASKIKQEILSSPELKELLGQVDVRIDADGLNIEIMDTAQSSMFTSGSATILPDASLAFSKLAGILNTVPNKIDVIGHTDSKPFRSSGYYTNWELSSDRANAARKLLEKEGLGVGRIESIVGKADTELRNKENPEDESNRRITLKIRFMKTSDPEITDMPGILKGLSSAQKDWEMNKQIVPTSDNTNLPISDKPTVQREDPVHSMTVEDVLTDVNKKFQEKHAKDKPKDSKLDIEKSPVFQENPVIGPAEFFDK